MLPVQLFEQPLYKLHLDLVTKPKVYVGKFSTYGNDVTPGFMNRLGTCSSLCAIKRVFSSRKVRNLATVAISFLFGN